MVPRRRLQQQSWVFRTRSEAGRWSRRPRWAFPGTFAEVFRYSAAVATRKACRPAGRRPFGRPRWRMMTWPRTRGRVVCRRCRRRRWPRRRRHRRCPCPPRSARAWTRPRLCRCDGAAVSRPSQTDVRPRRSVGWRAALLLHHPRTAAACDVSVTVTTCCCCWHSATLCGPSTATGTPIVVTAKVTCENHRH